MRNLLALLGLIVAAIAAWWLFFRKGSQEDAAKTASTNAKKDKMNSGNSGSADPAYDGAKTCYKVPPEFPKYQPVALPAGAQALLGIPDLDWTTSYQDRLLGWFVAIDVTPAEYVLNYYGKDLVMQYLNSPVGQYPSSIVLKGSARCNSAKSDKMGGYTLI